MQKDPNVATLLDKEIAPTCGACVMTGSAGRACCPDNAGNVRGVAMRS